MHHLLHTTPFAPTQRSSSNTYNEANCHPLLPLVRRPRRRRQRASGSPCPLSSTSSSLIETFRSSHLRCLPPSPLRQTYVRSTCSLLPVRLTLRRARQDELVALGRSVRTLYTVHHHTPSLVLTPVVGAGIQPSRHLGGCRTRRPYSKFYLKRYTHLESFVQGYNRRDTMEAAGRSVGATIPLHDTLANLMRATQGYN